MTLLVSVRGSPVLGEWECTGAETRVLLAASVAASEWLFLLNSRERGRSLLGVRVRLMGPKGPGVALKMLMMVVVMRAESLLLWSTLGLLLPMSSQLLLMSSSPVLT